MCSYRTLYLQEFLVRVLEGGNPLVGHWVYDSHKEYENIVAKSAPGQSLVRCEQMTLSQISLKVCFFKLKWYPLKIIWNMCFNVYVWISEDKKRLRFLHVMWKANSNLFYWCKYKNQEDWNLQEFYKWNGIPFPKLRSSTHTKIVKIKDFWILKMLCLLRRWK